MLAWPFSVPCLFIYTYRMILSLCNMFRLVSSLIQFKVKPAVFAITAIHVLLSRKYIELFLSLIGTKLGFIFSKLLWSLNYKYLRLWITLTFVITIMKKLIKVCRHATKRIYLVLMLKWNSSHDRHWWSGLTSVSSGLSRDDNFTCYHRNYVMIVCYMECFKLNICNFWTVILLVFIHL